MPIARRRARKSGNNKLSSLAVLLVVFFLAAVIAGKFNLVNPPTSTSPSTAPSASSGSANGAQDSLKALSALSIVDKTSRANYSRDQFGQAWLDVDRNSCDTRNDILGRDLTNVVKDKDNCTVLSGTLHDPYTNKDINFVRGKKTSSAVQIDHIIPLSDAWQKGASSWDLAKREQFANDPMNLLAVDGPTNGSKSDSDASEWMPPNAQYACQYINQQIAVKAKYSLSITQSEKNKMQEVLQKDC